MKDSVVLIALVSFIIGMSTMDLRADGGEKNCKQPKALLTATCVSGGAGLLSLGLGLYGMYTYDGAGADVYNGVLLLMAPGYLVTSAVLGTITLIRYHQYKECMLQKNVSMGVVYNPRVHLTGVNLRFTLPDFASRSRLP
jgi:tetrahydromethanopterin S-methyltransferase subunit D